MLFKFSNWYFSRKALPHWGILAFDSLIVTFSAFVGLSVQASESDVYWSLPAVWLGLLTAVLVFWIPFRLFHTYAGVVRYTSFVDMQRLASASFIGTSILWALSWFIQPGGAYVAVPETIGCVVIFMVSTLGLWASRLVVKRTYDYYRTHEAEPIVIYGTKAGGVSLAKSLYTLRDKKYRLVAFISDDPNMKGAYLMGKKVYMNGTGIAEQFKQLGVKVLFVSPLKSDLFRNNAQMVDEFLAAGIRIKMFPAVQVWDGKSDLTLNHLKEVDIEDLLPRDKIEVDLEAIGALLKGRKILITGAAGSIGSEMVRQVALFSPAEMVLIDQAETPMHDIRRMMSTLFGHIKNETIVTSIANQKHMEKIFAAHRPDYVFHAAAYKHVPMMEDNPGVAIQNNVYGTRVIADLSVQYGVKKFVMISTDKAVNPTNVMGCSKRICEIYCQSLNKAIEEGCVKGVTQFVTTRFGNVLGSNGSVIPIFKEQIKAGGPIMVTHPDIIRYFMLIPEACRLVLEAGTMGKGGEIFVFDMGQPVKIVDLAKRMIQLSGAQHVEIKFSGLRDGEKLYEELLSTKENTKATHHPKIMVAQVREYDYDVAVRNEERLLEASLSFEDMEIVKIMKEIVPEFKSQHSKYEVLDK